MKKYTDWYVELHPSQIAIDVHDHILNHLPQRLAIGAAIIVCEQPERFKPSLAKRWKKVMSSVERSYASTLDAQLRKEVTKKLELMRSTTFALQPGKATNGPVVWLQSPDAICIPPNCATLYIATVVTQDKLDECVERMPKKRAVICYSGGRSVTMPHKQA